MQTFPVSFENTLKTLLGFPAVAADDVPIMNPPLDPSVEQFQSDFLKVIFETVDASRGAILLLDREGHEFVTATYGEHGNAKTSRSAAIKEFDTTLANALSHVNRLEALVSNTVANDVMVMTAWQAARRIERSGGTKSPDRASPPVSGAIVSTA